MSTQPPRSYPQQPQLSTIKATPLDLSPPTGRLAWRVAPGTGWGWVPAVCAKLREVQRGGALLWGGEARGLPLNVSGFLLSEVRFPW